MWYVEFNTGVVRRFSTELEMYRWLWEESQYMHGYIVGYGRDYSYNEEVSKEE